eukprot:7499200-Lingulodinium_polyedra.AAC.1
MPVRIGRGCCGHHLPGGLHTCTGPLPFFGAGAGVRAGLPRAVCGPGWSTRWQCSPGAAQGGAR